ncbi:MAG: HypC/HybG/HupF family hydrogenase formation chaperone [Melioribacteraceae bacterium]|jgi:hydrogenase expression/formation protein HypC|nr:HypC/HybG/HupF family hydrogenase formation chaperone [Melioribacteraceae bacterium]
MCLAIPGKIISIEDEKDGIKMAKVSFGGIIKEVCLAWIENPEVGEYVLVHVGFALNKVDAREAEETFRIINEV